MVEIGIQAYLQYLSSTMRDLWMPVFAFADGPGPFAGSVLRIGRLGPGPVDVLTAPLLIVFIVALLG